MSDSTAGQASLLLVDDQPMVIRALRAALADYTDVRFATNATDALRVARERTPDIVLLDSEMPGGNGLEVCRELKRDPAFEQVTIIFVSAHDSAAFEVEALAAGAADFIRKPISSARVQLRVGLHLQLRGATRKASELGSSESSLVPGPAVPRTGWETARELGAEPQATFDFRTLAESVPHMVWTCRAEGPCDYLSPQWLRYTGIPAESQLGYGWLEQLHPDDVEPTKDRWTRAAAHCEEFHTEFRIRRHDGCYRWFKTRAVPIRGGGGAVVKWIGTNTDVQDLRDAQEEASRLNAQLKAAASSQQTRTAQLRCSTPRPSDFSVMRRTSWSANARRGSSMIPTRSRPMATDCGGRRARTSRAPSTYSSGERGSVDRSTPTSGPTSPVAVNESRSY